MCLPQAARLFPLPASKTGTRRLFPAWLAMKIATFNVNGINGRLPVLLRWLDEAAPDVVCLQELKAPEGKFPAAAIEASGYGALWCGQKSWNGVAILARETEPVATQRSLPGMDDGQSRYVEAAVQGVLIGCLYLPNGNPAPGPKFEYKLAWLKRFLDHAAELVSLNAPVVLAGDYNIIPTEMDVYKPERWKKDGLFRSEVRAAFANMQEAGWVDALRHLYPDDVIFTFWDYFRNAWQRNAGLRLDHLMLNATAMPLLRAAGVDRDVRGWEKASDHAPVWIEISRETVISRVPKAKSLPRDGRQSPPNGRLPL